MNTHVRDNLTFLATPPAVRCYNDANISVNSGSATALTFNTDRYDTASLHSTSSNTSRLTAPVAGVYCITGHVEIESNSTGYRQLTIRLNGTTHIANILTPAANGVVHQLSVSTLYSLAANDYAELVVGHNAGVALNVVTSTNLSPEFAMSWIGFTS